MERSALIRGFKAMMEKSHLEIKNLREIKLKERFRRNIFNSFTFNRKIKNQMIT